MSPEERAWALLEKHSLVWGLDGFSERALHLMAGTLASAIRQAEASARNEALEGAAVMLDGKAYIASDWTAANTLEIARDAIRNLKTKD